MRAFTALNTNIEMIGMTHESAPLSIDEDAKTNKK